MPRDHVIQGTNDVIYMFLNKLTLMNDYPELAISNFVYSKL
jgi:hypothetical protein